MSQKIVLIFSASIYSKNNCATIRFRDTAHQTAIFDEFRESLCTACGLSALHILHFLTVSLPTNLEPCFVRKKENTQHPNPFL
jgi:hypothetical protein